MQPSRRTLNTAGVVLTRTAAECRRAAVRHSHTVRCLRPSGNHVRFNSNGTSNENYRHAGKHNAEKHLTLTATRCFSSVSATVNPDNTVLSSSFNNTFNASASSSKNPSDTNSNGGSDENAENSDASGTNTSDPESTANNPNSIEIDGKPCALPPGTASDGGSEAELSESVSEGPASTILEVAEFNDLGSSIPAECRKGTCGACKVVVDVEGQEPAFPGMTVTTLPQSVIAKTKAPVEVADQTIEALEHLCLGLPGESQALQYDAHGSVKRLVKGLERKIVVAIELETLTDITFPRLANLKVGVRKLRKFFDLKPNIHLDHAYLNDLELLVIARMARFHNDQIKFLNLNYSSAGDSSCPFIAEHLIRRLRLRSLFLTANSIGDEGFINHLAPAMHDNDSLQILELRKNRITDEGAKALAKMLSMKGQVVGFSSSSTDNSNLQLTSKSELTSLFLSGNQIGDEGAVKLVTCEGLQNCKIWLADNPISDGAKAAIRDVAGKHRIKL